MRLSEWPSRWKKPLLCNKMNKSQIFWLWLCIFVQYSGIRLLRFLPWIPQHSYDIHYRQKLDVICIECHQFPSNGSKFTVMHQSYYFEHLSCFIFLFWFITYEWTNAVFQKKIVVEKTDVTKYSIEERLQLHHCHTKISKRAVHVCLSSFCSDCIQMK